MELSTRSQSCLQTSFQIGSNRAWRTKNVPPQLSELTLETHAGMSFKLANKVVAKVLLNANLATELLAGLNHILICTSKSEMPSKVAVGVPKFWCRRLNDLGNIAVGHDTLEAVLRLGESEFFWNIDRLPA